MRKVEVIPLNKLIKVLDTGYFVVLCKVALKRHDWDSSLLLIQDADSLNKKNEVSLKQFRITVDGESYKTIMFSRGKKIKLT